jgi:hypothetical protein
MSARIRFSRITIAAALSSWVRTAGRIAARPAAVSMARMPASRYLIGSTPELFARRISSDVSYYAA